MRELHILIVDMLSTEYGPNYDKNLHKVEILHTKIPYIPLLYFSKQLNQY